MNQEIAHSVLAHENLGFLPEASIHRMDKWKAAKNATPMRLLAHVILIHSLKSDFCSCMQINVIILPGIHVRRMPFGAW